ncbi:MAG: cysteine desulfurase [Streptococcaceae bacterium]|jgi:cysteine desulfurase|nr:cysteine desulfurase [Streptococcaceae bacterium]
MIYFDNSATTQIYSESLKAYTDTATRVFGNPSSLHSLGTQANRLLDLARRQIADLMSVDSGEIFFTSGGTEGDNWVIKGTAFAKQAFGNHLIISAIEHPAVKKAAESLIPLGFSIDYLPVDNKGIVKSEMLTELIKPETILVSVMAVNNEVGSIQPIAEISAILAQYPKIHFHVDAVQAVGKLDVADFLTERLDFLTASAHKFHGPRGVGFIYAKKGRRLKALLDGGAQELGQRSTTENLPAIVAMAKALRISMTRSTRFLEKSQALKASLSGALAQYPQVIQLSATQDFVPYILTIALKGLRGEVLVHALEERQIFVSTTSACSSKKEQMAATLIAMKVKPEIAQGAIRISLGEDNTIAEVEQFMLAFKQVLKRVERIR